MRFEGGSARSRRIWSTSARSDSRRNGRQRRPGFFLLIESLPENGQQRAILRPARRFLAAKDVGQARHEQLEPPEPHAHRPRAQRGDGANPVYPRHEIELQPVAVPHHPIELRHRIEGPQYDRIEIVRDSLELSEIRGRPSEHEVEIHRGHGRSMNRGGGVADKNCLEPMPGEQPCDQLELWFGIHGSKTSGPRVGGHL